MSFLDELKNRDAEGVKHKPVNKSGIASNDTRRTDKQIGDKFETSYVQEPRFEGGQAQTVENEEREIVDRKHSEKALEKIFKNHVTFKDYLQALYWRLTE